MKKSYCGSGSLIYLSPQPQVFHDCLLYSSLYELTKILISPTPFQGGGELAALRICGVLNSVLGGRPRVLALTIRDSQCNSSQVSSIFSRFVVFFIQPLRSHLSDFLVEFMVFASDPQIKWLENPILPPHPLARIPQSVCDDLLNDNGTHLLPGKQQACR